MYGVFTYICLKFMVNVGEYTIPGAFGNGENKFFTFFFFTPVLCLRHGSCSSIQVRPQMALEAGLLAIKSMYLGNLL